MNDTPKFTPGTWLLGEDQCVDETWSIVTTTGGSVIANVNDRHDRLANARLIAAAPELLEALRITRNRLHNAITSLGASTVFATEGCREADVAIAKAGGR